MADPDHVPARAAKLSKADEQRFTAQYRKNWRTLRRWIDDGVLKNDPCPLHDARLMPGWWSRVHPGYRVPPEIESAAADAAIAAARAAAAPDPSMAAANVATGDTGSAPLPARIDAPVEAVPPSPVPSPARPIDIDSFDPEEGDRLRELKQLRDARWHQLREALFRGEDAGHLETKWTKLCDTIDRIETRVTERLKKRGLYRLATEVDNDLAQTAELMRQIDASQERRILERCPSLTPEQRAEVAEAVRLSNRAKESLLARLSSSAGDDLLKDLAA